MEIHAYIQALLKAATEAGFEAAEVYHFAGDSFQAMTAQGEIAQYTVKSTNGLSLRGLYKGKMGYAATESMDEASIKQMVEAIRESAELNEDDAVQEIYPGDKEYPQIDAFNPALEAVRAEDKLALVKEVEQKALAYNPLIAQVSYNQISTQMNTIRIVNTYGLDVSFKGNFCAAFTQPVAKDGDRVATGFGLAVGRSMADLDAEKIARMGAEEAIFMLKAAPVASGTYRAIIRYNAMPDLMSAFAGIFSAEQAQQGMSLLAGREGEQIASDIVTIYDDPIRSDSYAACPFDAEGVACYKKPLVEKGKLCTLLHDLKTARKAGVKTTGNAAKGSYAGTIFVAPHCMYIEPGTQTLEELEANMGDGIVITDVSGLHAGANAVSGDFSLLAKGYTVKGGKRDAAVEQITIAGNFYQLLKNIRALDNNILFLGDSVASPSVDIGEISVAGK